MSLRTRNNGSGVAGARGRARQQASRAAPLAKNAGEAVKQRADEAAAWAAPLAKNAGVAVKQRADEAAAWATPHVRDARAWAAPRVERTGTAVQEKLAPQVSDMLTRAARQLDPAPKPARRSRLATGIALLAAAASALAAAALLRRRLTPADADTVGETAASGQASADQASADQASAAADAADVNGQVHTT